MKKQSGFTLIELMVVMAIIAILATAGLAAYTGYIRKARDTTRIADLAAINSIVLADMSSDGLPPATGDIVGIISAANNGQPISDPLGTDSSCFNAISTSGTGASPCGYTYYTCASGTGYAITALFESASNTALYDDNNSGTVVGSSSNYDIGSCQTGSSDGSQAI